MLFTIILIVIAIIGITYLVRTFYDLSINNIIIYVLAFALFFVLVNKSNTYEKGYNAAIHDAELVGIGQDGYQLNFNGEVHNYTFD